MNRVVSYSVGLALALILTVTAFGLVLAHVYAAPGIIPTGLLLPVILTLAMIQLVVQLVFFLHLGQGKESRWNAALFSFTFFGILVIVIASVWIMAHLNYNMTPTQIINYDVEQSGF